MKKCLVFGLPLALVSVLMVSAVAAASHSNLVGSWSGIGKGLSPETGFYDIPLTMNIMEVQGDLFRGTLTATPPGGTIATIPFSGVILMPEKELYISLSDTMRPRTARCSPAYEAGWRAGLAGPSGKTSHPATAGPSG